MPSYIAWDHACTNCLHLQTELHDRKDVKDLIKCEICDTITSERLISANISTSKTSASIPDGTNRRFDILREGLSLKKELARAREALGNKDTMANREGEKRVQREIKKLNKKGN